MISSFLVLSNKDFLTILQWQLERTPVRVCWVPKVTTLCFRFRKILPPELVVTHELYPVHSLYFRTLYK